MSGVSVTGGATDVTRYFALRLAATGVEATGLTITNFDLQYTRCGVAPSTKVDATALAATDSAHADNQAIEVDATDQPGLYRVDWPDAAFAAGVPFVILTVKCATVFTEHMCVPIDPPVNATKLAGTALTGRDIGASVLLSSGTGAGQVSLSSGLVTLAGVTHTGAVIPTVSTLTGHTPQTGDSFARLGAPAGASVSADIAAVPTATENADELLKRDWTSVTGEAARCVLNALRFPRNKWNVAGGTLTVTKEDDVTVAWTAAVSSDAAADPITGVDPA